MTPQRAIQVLVAADWTETKIASAVGTKQPTINRIKSGKQESCSYELGAALISLAESVGQPPKRRARAA